jgi:hypothetical protein
MRPSEETVKTLNLLVERIEANPGRLIDPKEMAEAGETIDVSNVLETLPDGLSQEDFVGILRLSMLTECATESYAAIFREGARVHDAPWLARFTDRTWVPDELSHASPFKAMLMSLGFSEAELDSEIADVQDARYDHCCGITPVELTAYGMIQEQLTDQWHGLVADLIKPVAPYAAHMANRVKARETQHLMWYREMTAILVAGKPDLLPLVADAILGFQMPGRQLLPELQGRALYWMPPLKADFTKVAKDLVRNFSEVAGSSRGSGELLTDVASRRGFSIGPIPIRMAKVILRQLGGLGYEVLGEAVRERVGLPVAWSNGNDEQGRRGFHWGLPGKIRSAARSQVAQRIDLRAVTGETTPRS